MLEKPNVLRVSSRKYANNVAYRMLKVILNHPREAMIIINKGEFQEALYERTVNSERLLYEIIDSCGGDSKQLNIKIVKEGEESDVSS